MVFSVYSSPDSPIPGPRLTGDNWLEHEEDLDMVLLLLKIPESFNLERLVQTVYATRPGWDKGRTEMEPDRFCGHQRNEKSMLVAA